MRLCKVIFESELPKEVRDFEKKTFSIVLGFANPYDRIPSIKSKKPHIIIDRLLEWCATKYNFGKGFYDRVTSTFLEELIHYLSKMSLEKDEHKIKRAVRKLIKLSGELK